MKMGLIVAAAFAASMFAAPVFAGSTASSTTEVEVTGGSAGFGNVQVNASDNGKASASDLFGTSTVTTSNTAIGSDATHGFALGDFQIIGEETGSAASHF